MNYGKTAGQTLLLPIYMHLLSRNPDYGLGYPQKSKKVVRPFLPKFTKNLDILPIIKYSNG